MRQQFIEMESFYPSKGVTTGTYIDADFDEYDGMPGIVRHDCPWAECCVECDGGVIYENKICKEHYASLQEIIEAFELEVTDEQYGTRIKDGINNRYFPGDRESSICVWFTMYNPSLYYNLRRIDEAQT